MNRMRGKIKIELKSDLCAGSGYAYAGIIDSDVAYDDHGIPFIPARRLKGCMREAARLICPEQVEAIFGRRGADGAKGVVIGSAHIEKYREIVQEIQSLKERHQAAAACLTSQNILGMYTNVRAQTRIDADTGVAEDNSLRFLRVVGQYDPMSGQPLCFYADIEFDSILEEPLIRIAKATRNLGMNRNRGLGSVRCTLEEIEKAGGDEHPVRGAIEGKACITYILRNQEPLLMSSSNHEVSDSFISGKSVLGRLAGEYLKRSGNNAGSEEFMRLFLDGSVIFTDANITFPPKQDRENAKAWPSYYPAPLYLNRLKKTRKLVNLIGNQAGEEPLDPEYRADPGNQPKKLKTQYVCEAADNVYDVAEAERELIYHNSRNGMKRGETGVLYSAEALKEGQYFKGRIYTDGKYVPVLMDLLEHAGLSFGKSKTAQYGVCGLEAVRAEAVSGQSIPIAPGEKVAVTLCSDAVFLDENGYTVKFDQVKQLIAERLHIPYDREPDTESMVQTKEITGYNTKWNLKRQAVPAIKAGSVFVYHIDGQKADGAVLDLSEHFVGERNLEGHGEVRISEVRRMSYQADSYERQQEGESGKERADMCRPFLEAIVSRRILEELVYNYVGPKTRKLKMSASTIGRITLMLKESLNECVDDTEKAFENFCGRVDSIKRAAENREAKKLLRETLLGDESAGKGYWIDVDKMLSSEENVQLRELSEILKECWQEEYERNMRKLWSSYMMSILTYYKYQKKNRESGGEDDE